jgi:hypothetical protein
MEENVMKFSWKTIVGVLLIAVSTVLGFLTKTPILVTTSIIGIVAGATLAISEQVKKTTLSGWKLVVYLIGTIGGTVLLSLSGYSDVVIGEIAGAVLLIVSVIFGIAVDKAKKD